MNRFRSVFDRKLYEMSRRLDVCLPLLLLLRDARLLTDQQLESLELLQNNTQRVHDLIVILCRLDDSSFGVFCSVLIEAGQPGVVNLLLSEAQPIAATRDNTGENPVRVPGQPLRRDGGAERERQILELEEIIEADYGLPDELLRRGILTLTEWELLNHLRETERYRVQMRISCLMENVENSIRRTNESLLAALTDSSFLSSLNETDQSHIANFIMQHRFNDPARNGDCYPLNVQQRMRFHPCPSLTERSDLNSRDPTLLALLTAAEVLSQGQHDYIMADVPRSVSNERLLMTMKRRSVAHAKTFIRCLIQTEQRRVIAKLDEPGIFVCIHTSINHPVVTNEDKQARESWFVRFFNWVLSARTNSTQYTPVRTAVDCLQSKGCAFRYVEARGSIAWCIVCQTRDSLKRLRDMYMSNELAHVLQDLFNSVCGGNEVLPLLVEWRTEDEYDREFSQFIGPDDVEASDTEITTAMNMNGPTNSLNILLLGETGVGKSTFINALANYLTYPTLSDAENGKQTALIACKFTLVDENLEEQTITNGVDKNEDLTEGQSATQMPQTHCFRTSDREVRIIDTPGIGDVRGPDQDKKNMQNILTHLARYDKLHGIVLLMHPNRAKENILFRFCINELMIHLHRDACKNIVICFTNSRGTFYKPGDSMTSLKAFLQKNEGVHIDLTNRNNIYCMDNESFRFLMAVQHGVHFTDDERLNFAISWTKSCTESKRLISHIESLKPHRISETTSLNGIRKTIVALSRPIAEIVKNIEYNISVAKDKEEEIFNEKMTVGDLQEKLFVPIIDLEPISLGYPRTVCTASKCVRVLKVGDVEKKEYKTICHDKCQIVTEPNVISNAELQRCAAMGNSRTTCQKCGCSWDRHMHITYETKQVTKNVEDENIRKLLRNKRSTVEAIRQFKEDLAQRIQELETEKKQIMEASAKCACFLRNNAISPVNDAMGQYMDYLIELEKGKTAQGGSRATLEQMIQTKNTYITEIEILQEAMKNKSKGAQHSPIDVDSISLLIAELYQLKHFGPKLIAVMETVGKGDTRAAYLSEKVHVVVEADVSFTRSAISTVKSKLGLQK